MEVLQHNSSMPQKLEVNEICCCMTRSNVIKIERKKNRS